MDRSFNWTQVEAVLATIETGSLSAAARKLGMSQPTVGRQVSALEADLQVIIFERVGGRLELTPFGQELRPHFEAMRNAADKTLLSARGQSEKIEGAVSITCSDIFAAHLMPQIIKPLQARAPDLSIEIIAANEISDLQRREADIAIRNVRPTEPELYGKFLGDTRASLFGATSYLDVFGRPSNLSGYESADFIGFASGQDAAEYKRRLGMSIPEANFKVSSQSGLTMLELLRAGLGLSLMSDSVVQNMPELEAVLPEQIDVRFPIWLIAHQELRRSARIRLVWDHLEEWFRASGVLM